MSELFSDFERLIVENRPLIDVRAPCEFSQGAIPCSINLPILDDDQRAAVGTCYKKQGPEAAMVLGHKLISGELKQQRLQGWIRELEEHPDAILCCFRGGDRSRITQQWLANEGYSRPRVQGGYKALRRYLIDTIEQSCVRDNWWVLSGMTGSGKTHLLHQLKMAIDLEGLAHHRGSSFGRMIEEQPCQINFENALAKSILEQYQQGQHSFIVEDESRLIGRCCLPDTLYDTMQQAPIVALEATQEERAQQIREDYVDDMYQRYLRHYGETSGIPAYRQYLTDSLTRLKKRLGDQGLRSINDKLQSAIDTQLDNGDTQAHLAWIHELLERYYDPMYSYQQQRKGSRITFQGDRQACLEFIREKLS
ncbi:tRNA 2-selenouridine(34) synthase MnmH [Dongshaea marina]|uniref:tRNA 2-selenouridine(34) synthase MnmH n=1 Tax=Dongshaea marina TaxID=2047966 RepID=UPI000D3E5761|nr:tRNA 2-selenouridine(34) synthase MnmH [Dongshaea marina]